MDSLKGAITTAPTVGADTVQEVQETTVDADTVQAIQETPTVGTDTVATNQQAQPDKSARFKEKAENQASKVIAELEKLQKLSNRKYYTYTPEQINELFGAIQTALDEAKASFTSDNAEKKKLFTFSA